MIPSIVDDYFSLAFVRLVVNTFGGSNFITPAAPIVFMLERVTSIIYALSWVVPQPFIAANAILIH
jgi:hypothetical protein